MSSRDTRTEILDNFDDDNWTPMENASATYRRNSLRELRTKPVNTLQRARSEGFQQVTGDERVTRCNREDHVQTRDTPRAGSAPIRFSVQQCAQNPRENNVAIRRSTKVQPCEWSRSRRVIMSRVFNSGSGTVCTLEIKASYCALNPWYYI